MNVMTLGEKIKNLRTDNNMTQEALAERLYVSRTAVSKWERNAGFPGIDSLKSISEIFDITIDELLSSEDLISIAKNEKKTAEYGYINIAAVISDLFFVLFLFLPLYSQKKGAFINSVNLFILNDITAWLKITYFTVIGLVILTGITELVFYIAKNKKLTDITQILSIAFGAAALFLFIISLEPYAATLAFILLAVKILLQFKKRKI